MKCELHFTAHSIVVRNLPASSKLRTLQMWVLAFFPSFFGHTQIGDTSQGHFGNVQKKPHIFRNEEINEICPQKILCEVESRQNERLRMQGFTKEHTNKKEVIEFYPISISFFLFSQKCKTRYLSYLRHHLE